MENSSYNKSNEILDEQRVRITLKLSYVTRPEFLIIRVYNKTSETDVLSALPRQTRRREKRLKYR